MPTSFHPLGLEGLILIEPQIFTDSRGYFFESFKESGLRANGIPAHFVQENHSSSTGGVIRGLHYQRAPYAQAKLVRVLAGAIYDVVVDLRDTSPTCGKWIGIELSASNRKQLYVPTGFAHGFCVLSEQAEISYLCTAEYSPQAEGGIAWDDPTLAIEWPISNPMLSARDETWGAFKPLPAAEWQG
ncbi:MAG: dTDP-4-dehydrorhamnose 3,5-epimerase [Acidobacteria bacterium]|nr:dTDP-4-dehydrorhamnose 3,5-epimerase [Acidobacteriota bacterium]